MKRILTAATLAASLGMTAALPAHAVSTGDSSIPYVNIGPEFVLTDSARASDDGIGGRVGLGVPIGTSGHAAIEFSLYNSVMDRDSDGSNDYQTGLSIDYVRDFLHGRVRPFVLAGLSAAEDDVLGDNNFHGAINLGGGALFGTPLPFAREMGVRLEGRVMGHANDDSYPNEDFLVDYRIGVSLHLPLSRYFNSHGRRAPVKDCALAVVDPATGRRDCIVDTDGDGVIDSRDACPGTPRGASVDSRGCSTGVNDATEVLVLRGVTFENASARLTRSAKTVLDGVVDVLKGQRALLVEIAGHTDSQGAADYNLSLSQSRADSVKAYLVTKGVNGERLTSRGYGEYEPIASNGTAQGRQTNRRVEFRMIGE